MSERPINRESFGNATPMYIVIIIIAVVVVVVMFEWCCIPRSSSVRYQKKKKLLLSMMVFFGAIAVGKAEGFRHSSWEDGSVIVLPQSLT